VEHLFDYIFGDNDFLLAYRASRRIKGSFDVILFFLTFLYFLEFHASEWKLNTETGKRERLCTYKVTVSAVFGQTTICSNEKQVRQYILF
jgi:hypothetical protein